LKFDDTGLTDSQKYRKLLLEEPLDFMNLVKTYTMFLQYISVISSTNLNDSYVNDDDRKF